MYATNYLENAVLNAMRNISFSAPSNSYVALFLSNPTDTGTAGTEVSYAGYARKQIEFSAPAVSGAAMSIKNTQQITFAESPVAAGTATYIGLMDSVIGGNMLAYGQLTEELVIHEGYAPVLLAGEVEFTSSGNMSNAFKTKFLNIFRGQNLSGFEPYFALYNGNPEAGGAELSGDNYARVKLDMTAPAEAESGQNYIENSAAVNFNRPSSGWGTYNYSVIYNAAASGEPVWGKEFSPAREIKKGYMPTIGIGGVRVAMN